LIAAERDGEIVEEGAHLLAPQPQPFEEVLSWGLLEAATLPGTSGWGRVRSESCSQECLIAGDETVTRSSSELAIAGSSGLLNGGFHLAQELLELAGPACWYCSSRKVSSPTRIASSRTMCLESVGMAISRASV
jgi:hypothetical protein